MTCPTESFGPPQGKEWSVQQVQSQVAQCPWSDPCNVSVYAPGPGQAGMSRTTWNTENGWPDGKTVGAKKLQWVHHGSWQSFGLRCGQEQDDGGWKQSEKDGSWDYKRRERLNSVSKWRLLHLLFFSSVYLYVFLLPRLKALITALDRFTCFYFFFREEVTLGAYLNPLLVLFSI